MMKSKASAALLRLKEIDKKYKIRYEETKKEELSSENTESLVRQSVEGQNNTQSASEVEEKEIFKPSLSIKIPETFNEQLESHSSSNEASISARVSIVDKTLKGDKNIESQSLSEIEEQLEDADSISEVLDDTENSDEKIAEKKSKEEIEKIETKDFPLKLAEKHISVQEKQLENYSSIENDAHWNDYFNSSFESYSSVYESQSIQEAIINSNSALSSNRNDDYVGRKDILDTSIVAEEVEKKKEEMGANFAEKVEKTKEEMRASFAENVEKKKEEITEKLGKNNEEKKIEILENEDEEIVEESLNSIEATNSMRNSLSSESESEKLNSKRSNLEINKQKKVDSKKNDSSIDSKLSKDDIKSEKSERKRKKLKESEKSLSGKSEISLKSLSNTNSSIIQSSKDQREKNYSESADKIEKNDSEEKSSSEKDNFLHEKLDKIRITNEQSGYKTKHESLKLLRESRRDRKKSSDYSEEIGKLPKNNDELSESRSRQKRSKQKSRLSKSSTCCRVNKIPEIKRKDIELERFNMRLMNLRLEQERQLMLCYMKNFEDDRDKFLQWPDQFYSARKSENPIIKPLNFQNVLNFAKPDSDSTKEQFNFPDNHLAMMKNRVIEIRQWLKDQFIIYQNYSGIAAAINAKYITESKKIEIESMSRYVSPINPAVFPVLAIVLLGIGIFFTAWFFVYEVTSTKFTRDIFKELLVSLVAAIFSGFGVLFLLLWVGIYV